MLCEFNMQLRLCPTVVLVVPTVAATTCRFHWDIWKDLNELRVLQADTVLSLNWQT